MSQRPFDPSRRALSRIMLGWPLAALAAADEKKDASPRAGCLAATEPGLSAEERARLEKSIAEGEKSLAAIRDFKLPPDVAPSLRFRAMKAKRR